MTLVFAVAALLAQCVLGVADPASFVDPHIGTGGTGFGVGSDPPGAQVPFGAMRASPDTSDEANYVLSYDHYGGYHYSDNHIQAFSHTHCVGAGVADWGNIGIMSVLGMSNEKTHSDGYRSKFSHDQEVASPGYYSAFLDTPGIFAEVAACGTHSAVYRFTFPSGSIFDKNTPVVLVDLFHSVAPNAVRNASAFFNQETNLLTGSVLNFGSLTGQNGRGVDVYFAISPNQKPVSFGMWNDGVIAVNQTALTGVKIGAYLDFGTGSFDPSVEIAIAISFISIEQALANLASQVNGGDFDTCLATTTTTWNSTLSQIVITTNTTTMTEYTQQQLVKFYTALYHAHMAPTNYIEAGAQYLGMDNALHVLQPPNQNYYSDMSIWDIHRTQFPLISLLHPSVASDIINSLVLMYLQGGSIPRWPMANVYTGCMVGAHANEMILDAFVKQLPNVNYSVAYEGMYAMMTSENNPHINLDALTQYIQYGYVPVDVIGGSVSLTLDYSFDDWALGTLGQGLDKPGFDVFLNRSQNYRNLWESESEFFCARNSSGDFHCDPLPADQNWIFGMTTPFIEGDQAEYRWFVPHDLPGLMSLFKSKTNYIDNLVTYFERTKDDNATILPNPWYWAGNEPSLLNAWEFNVAGRADLTQKYTHFAMNQAYNTQPDGIPGNDDYGTMSAWFVWAALGLYPLTGTDTYILGSPLFPEAIVHLDGGDLIITGYDASEANIYVQQASLNGQAIDMVNNPYVTFAQIANGAHLEFWLGPQPAAEFSQYYQ